MKCSFCDNQTLMTVRNNEGKLFNCCKTCYKEKNAKKPESLNCSVIYKPLIHGDKK